MGEKLEKSLRPVRKPTAEDMVMMKKLREQLGVYGDELTQYADDGSLHQKLKKIPVDQRLDAYYNGADKTVNVHEGIYNPYVIAHELRHMGLDKLIERAEGPEKEKLIGLLDNIPEEIIVETLDLLKNEYKQTIDLPDKMFGIIDGGKEERNYNRAIVEFLPSLKALYKARPSIFEGYGIEKEEDLVKFLNSNERFSDYNLVDNQDNRDALDEYAKEVFGVVKRAPGRDM